ncbi:nuclear transport factor 2 family protein [Streptomyces brevispora]|uniref:Nuclear transport factor 2 family protein n=1 Tax=Streptomyces brevispora TaxID=887462 RepID=A0A561UUE0_9ACTN|nr:nuclear transport factor 2 family protein [Streptomyces brevispora]TWG02967.1 SnoaL-like protein [Streptomyces brevispora]WSC15940.1 nuclear transport factor 2 family protein [Streptomyces brevispora]
MTASPKALQRLVDRQEIQDALARYARGVDRGDWELVRSAYHPDAHDQHGSFNGDIDGLISWLTDRFEGVDNSVHFLGNCLIEPTGPDSAVVETYFVSARLTTKDPHRTIDDGDALSRQAWGRYVDRFTRRDSMWRIARRTVVVDGRFQSPALGGARTADGSWGARNRTDPLHVARSAAGLTD